MSESNYFAMQYSLEEIVSPGSILGLNYSGMHDSAMAIVGPDSSILYASALERHSRIKQDGRPPTSLLAEVPWDNINTIAIPTDYRLELPIVKESRLLNVRLPKPRAHGLEHSPAFYDWLAILPKPVEFVCHQMAHAASAFWPSGFDNALCLTYDGGMSNSPWFGGLYMATREAGIKVLDQFNALEYAKITTLYTFVTALLGFSPNKHEGKITGLAARGRPTEACKLLLKHWFVEDYFGIESTLEWLFSYECVNNPLLFVNDARMELYRTEACKFSQEEMAASLQEFAENHVIDILKEAFKLGWGSSNICLAGGLFANVRINQKIAELGFNKIFVSPAMTDDGAALGAAWHVLSSRDSFVAPPKLESVYLGPQYRVSDIIQRLDEENIHYELLSTPAKSIADILSSGSIVGIFQNRMEFGPRALGNRSILAQATIESINESLNEKLNRTEFMPFAPVVRMEDAADCFFDSDRFVQCMEFMTVTVNCRPAFQKLCPAVVHLDLTARPQVVTSQSNSLMHSILTNYKERTGLPALVNTSFNIHEEPIVCSPLDAIQGFFEAGLDYLYLGDGVLVSIEKNPSARLRYLQKKCHRPSQSLASYRQIIANRSVLIKSQNEDLEAKEKVIQELKLAYDSTMERLLFLEGNGGPANV